MTDTFTDLTLNNGKTATFVGVDFWARPVYDIVAKSTEGDVDTFRVCCTELNGTYLHYYSPRNDTDGDPDYPLPKSYQPKTS